MCEHCNIRFLCAREGVYHGLPLHPAPLEGQELLRTSRAIPGRNESTQRHIPASRKTAETLSGLATSSHSTEWSNRSHEPVFSSFQPHCSAQEHSRVCSSMVYGAEWPPVTSPSPPVLGTPKMQTEPSLAAVWAETGISIFPLQGCKPAALGGGTTSSSSIPCTAKQQHQEICVYDTSTVTLGLAGFFLSLASLENVYGLKKKKIQQNLAKASVIFPCQGRGLKKKNSDKAFVVTVVHLYCRKSGEKQTFQR